MGLLKNTTPAFETEENTVVVSEADKAKTSVTVAEPAKTSVTVSAGTTVTTQKVDIKAMNQFKDAMRVDYNTLNQVVANSGNFMDRESDTTLGDTIVFKLLSYQDSYVVSPNDNDAESELVRYSNDGETCTDGTTVKEHLDFLRAEGYKKAALKQRVVLVVALEGASKSDKFNNTLVQIDLSPSSRTMWNRYMANVAYGLSIGKTTVEKACRVKAETSIARNGTNTFTQVVFNQAD